MIFWFVFNYIADLPTINLICNCSQRVLNNMSSLKVGKYYIDFTQVLGKGSTGNVYQGKNLQTNESLAIKAIQMSKVTGEVNKYLLESEKKAVNTIKSPYVIKTYDILQFNDFCYIIMEYCKNGSLKEYILQKGKLSNLEAISIFKKILVGYIAISEALFIHRDLKTANILIRTLGDPIIIDFGYCEMMMAKRPLIQYNVGSPSYMAPEVYYRSRYSEKSDVWSLGVILYEMLTGKTLDHGLDMHEYFRSMQKQGKPKIQIQGISQVAKQIFDSALQVAPQKRATCHKLKYIIDRSLIPEIQNQLNSVLSPKAGKNTEQVSSVKFIPATNFKYEPLKTEDPQQTQKFRVSQTQRVYEIQKNSKQTQSKINMARSPDRSSWPRITSTVYPLTPNFPIQTPFKSTKYEENVQRSQIINTEQSKLKTFSQLNNNFIQQSPIQPKRRQTQYQIQTNMPPQIFNIPPQQFFLHSPQSMKNSLVYRIK